MALRKRTNAYWQKRSTERVALLERQSEPYIRKVNAFFRNTFPAYAPPKIIGNQFGPITQNTVKEFQRRARVGGGIDGNIGPLTYKAMQNHGFKY